MKLRNKKTGEIGLVHCDATMFSNKIGVFIDNNHIDLRNPYKIYTSLAELNAEWEDAPEEPKEYWFIDYDGGIIPFSARKETATDKMMKSIGNYFDTREEAEKAVEKLKAWKRLKDKGFVFKGVNEVDGSIKTGLSKSVSISDSVEFYEDMALLFSGGEE